MSMNSTGHSGTDRINPSETPVCDREPCGLFHGASRIDMIFLFFITSLMKVMNTNPPAAEGSFDR
jgi:hypothetical protein